MTDRITLRSSGVRPLWTIRSINGVSLPRIPAQLTHELYVVDRDTHEDVNGNLQRTVLGEKDKFLISLPAMYERDLEELLQMVRATELTIVYEDFWDSSILRTGKFYHGDMKKSPYMFRADGNHLYDAGTSFNLIAYNVRPY